MHSILKWHQVNILIVTMGSLWVSNDLAFADIKPRKNPIPALEWVTLASRAEFEKLHKKRWEYASSKERKAYLESLKGRRRSSEPGRLQSNERPKLEWVLSQPALKTQATARSITRKHSIGFKPNLAKKFVLTKRFTRKSFIDRSQHSRSSR